MASLDKDNRFAKLLEWSREQGGQVHAAVEVYWDEVTQLSLRVRENSGSHLAAGDTAVVCPLSTSLSYLNALSGGTPLGRANATGPPALPFPDAFVQATPPHVIGRFFLVQQYLLGVDSHWHPYIAALPQPDDVQAWALPAVWQDGDLGLALLQGTNAGTAAAEMRANIDAEFNTASNLLRKAKYLDQAQYTRRLYEWAFCVFTSRSFRPSLVLAPELQTVLRGDDRGDEHASAAVNGIQLPPTCQIDDFSILLPVLDLGNHDPRARVTWEATAASPAASVAFRTDQPYAAGDQVFNNYGMKTNSELLLGYGFVLPPTAALHNDYVHLRKRGAAAGPDAGGMAGTATTPRDFLLSLRPMDDASSVVGGSRQWTRTDIGTGNETRRRPEFAIFEDGLLWDLCSQICTDEERKRLEADATSRIGGYKGVSVVSMDELRAAILDLVYGGSDGSVPGDEEQQNPFEALADRIQQTLLVKVGRDYEVLEETEPQEDEDEDEAEADRQTDNEKLADAYREQYGAVLEEALAVLVQGIDDDASSE